ncbi:MAG: hypothetical protein LBH37_00165 [Oscillospiraceae bacterium]|jgi:formylmethanofuran dehydrogenase subunit E|nr:hypothetical protein [Oscillospiraceae bacterium]
MSFKKNLAYDLSLFEAEKENKQALVRDNVIRLPVEKSKKLAFRAGAGKISLTLLALTTTLAFSITIINSQIELSELTEEIYKLNKNLEEDKNTETRLKISFESKLSLRDVEEYSKEILKMQKPENSQIEYINIPR